MSRRMENAIAELRRAYDEEVEPLVNEARKWKMAAQEREEQLVQAHADIAAAQRENDSLRERLAELERFQASVLRAVKGGDGSGSGSPGVLPAASHARSNEFTMMHSAAEDSGRSASRPGTAADIGGPSMSTLSTFSEAASLGQASNYRKSSPATFSVEQTAQRLYKDVERSIGPHLFRQFVEVIDNFRARDISVDETLQSFSRLIDDPALLRRARDLIFAAEDAALARVVASQRN